jgi:hypothetical protein
VAEAKRATWAWFAAAELLAGLTLALAVVAIVVAERLSVARDIITRTAEMAPAGFAAVEWVVLVGGVMVAGAVLWFSLERLTSRRRLLGGFGGAAIAAWALWQILEILDRAGTVADAFHVAAPLLAAAAVAVAGGEVVGGIGAAWERASVVRIQLIALAVLFVLVFRFPFTSDQLADVLRAWGDDTISRPAAGIAAALLLGATVRTSAARLLIPDPARATVIEDPSAVRIAGVGCAVAALILVCVGSEAAAFAVAAIAAVALLTSPTPQVGADRPGEEEPDGAATRRSLRRLAATLAVLPVMTLVAGLVAAATDSLLLAGPRTAETKQLVGWTIGVVALFALLAGRAHVVRDETRDKLPSPYVSGRVVVVTAFVIFYAVRWLPEVATVLMLLSALALALRLLGESGGLALWAALGAGIGMVGAVFAEPLTATRSYGAVALTMTTIALILVMLHAAASLAARRTPVGPLQRVPVVALLAGWIAVAWVTAPAELHQARTVMTSGEPTTFKQAVHTWLDAQPTGRDPLPMLIVGASGGGSKAAYWTDLVIDCVFGSATPVGDECNGDDTVAAERRGTLFLTSSVSGGSVGVHHLLRHMDKVGGSDPWLVDAAGTEALSPTLGWGLVHDLPAFMLGLSLDPSRCEQRVPCRVNGDRAAVQEAALGGLDDRALLDTVPLPHDPPAPLAIFNGASDGQRVLLSRATLAPGRDCPAGFEPIAGAVDGSDVLPADRDVPLTTAAVLSARFPGVAPAGRLGTAAGPEPVSGCGRPATRAPIQIRDGGYIENTGLLTIVDLLPSVDDAVASWETEADRDVDVWPIVLSVDDDVRNVDDESHYRSGLLGMGEPTNRTLRARYRLTECAFPGVSYLRISPQPHLGAQAATGWEVSKTSRRRDLVASLDSGANVQSLDQVRNALDGRQGGPERCPGGSWSTALK